MQKILNARVPLIKYTQELAGLDCDLSMSSSSGLHMSCLLHLWGSTDWRVRPLVATVRYRLVLSHWLRYSPLIGCIMICHKDRVKGKKCTLVGGFGCLELYLYGIRELVLVVSQPLIELTSLMSDGGPGNTS